MKHRVRTSKGVHPALAVFATVIVVVGVAGTAYLTSLTRGGGSSATPNGSSASTPDGTKAGAPQPSRLVLLNDEGATILTENGKEQKMTLGQFAQLIASSGRPIEGVDVANGAAKWYQDQYRSADGTRLAHLTTAKSDGASVLEIDSAATSSVVLRDGGNPLHDTRIHGWSADGSAVYVSAVATSTREIYQVKADGEIRALAQLPDNLLSLEGWNGAVWYATATPGQGIESDPVPPSEIHRVDTSGDTLMAHEDTKLVLSVVPGVSGMLAYLSNDGSGSVVMSNGDVKSLGEHRPLLFLHDGHLLIRDGFKLSLYSPSFGAVQPLATVPEGRVYAYELPATP